MDLSGYGPDYNIGFRAPFVPQHDAQSDRRSNDSIPCTNPIGASTITPRYSLIDNTPPGWAPTSGPFGTDALTLDTSFSDSYSYPMGFDMSHGDMLQSMAPVSTMAPWNVNPPYVASTNELRRDSLAMGFITSPTIKAEANDMPSVHDATAYESAATPGSRIKAASPTETCNGDAVPNAFSTDVDVLMKEIQTREGAVCAAEPHQQDEVCVVYPTNQSSSY